jgi:ribosome-associated protein
MTASAEARETALLAAQAAADKLATDVSIVDVSDRLAITDAFVLASAPNERQVQSIVDAVEERLRAHGVKPVRREGVAESRWVLLDFVDVVVHVQHAEERAYYALERLWKDCPVIPFVDAAAPSAGEGVARSAGDGATPSAGDGAAPSAGDGAAGVGQPDVSTVSDVSTASDDSAAAGGASQADDLFPFGDAGTAGQSAR